jgi:MFS family permease
LTTTIDRDPADSAADQSAGASGGGSGGPRRPRGVRGWFTSLSTFDSIRHHAFRAFFLSMLGQMASQNMQMVVRAYLAYELTGSYAALGIISLANAVPGLLLSLVGGAIADLVPYRKWVIQAGQLVNALNALTIAVLAFSGMLSFEFLFIAAVVQGTVMALMMPSRQSLIPALVPPDQLMNAVALNAAGMNSMRLFAPALGGFLLTAAGAGWVYFLMSGLYLFASVFLLRVPETRHVVARAGSVGGEVKAALKNMGEGLSYIRHDKTVGPLLAVNMVIVITAMPYMFLLAGFVQDVLGAEADSLGLLQSVSGIGSLAGALVIASVSWGRRGRAFLLGSAFQGLLLFLMFTFSTSVGMMAAFMVVMGLGQSARQSLSNVLVQTYVEDSYRGRVMSIYMLQFSLSQFGAFLTGMLAEAVGPRVALGGTSLALVVIALGALVFIPRLRNLE